MARQRQQSPQGPLAVSACVSRPRLPDGSTTEANLSPEQESPRARPHSSPEPASRNLCASALRSGLLRQAVHSSAVRDLRQPNGCTCLEVQIVFLPDTHVSPVGTAN